MKKCIDPNCFTLELYINSKMKGHITNILINDELDDNNEIIIGRTFPANSDESVNEKHFTLKRIPKYQYKDLLIHNLSDFGTYYKLPQVPDILSLNQYIIAGNTWIIVQKQGEKYLIEFYSATYQLVMKKEILVNTEYSVGRDAKCALCIKADPEMAPFHFLLKATSQNNIIVTSNYKKCSDFNGTWFQLNKRELLANVVDLRIGINSFIRIERCHPKTEEPGTHHHLSEEK